jgi:hypothetical protein
MLKSLGMDTMPGLTLAVPEAATTAADGQKRTRRKVEATA